MVGRDEGRGDICEDMQGVCGAQERARMFTEGARVPWCSNQVLAPRAWAAEGRACTCVTAEALTTAEFYDPAAGRGILTRCERDTAPNTVLYYRLVYWLAAQRDSGT